MLVSTDLVSRRTAFRSTASPRGYRSSMLYLAEFYSRAESTARQDRPGPSAFAQNDRIGISSAAPTPTKIVDHNGG